MHFLTKKRWGGAGLLLKIAGERHAALRRLSKRKPASNEKRRAKQRDGCWLGTRNGDWAAEGVEGKTKIRWRQLVIDEPVSSGGGRAAGEVRTVILVTTKSVFRSPVGRRPGPNSDRRRSIAGTGRIPTGFCRPAWVA